MRLILFLFLFPFATMADDLEVDVELFLAVDVSRSMSPAELEIQRRGYAEALTDPRVMNAIQDGMIGRIALTYVEWAGEYAQRTIVPWTLIDDADDARRVASSITVHFEDAMRRTSISGALLYAADNFDGNGFAGLRRVIDVSGDGPNNQGRPVLRARQSVLDKGIIINGLPLMTQDVLSEYWGIADLDLYYQHCVIGGPGAFVVPVLSWDQFAEAVTRKLVLEIAGLPVRLAREQARFGDDYDCLIGEKMWQRNRQIFAEP